MKIQITAPDIRIGGPKVSDTRKCPIGRAFARAGFSDYSIGATGFSVNDVLFLMPSRLHDFICRMIAFNCGDKDATKPRPFEFEFPKALGTAVLKAKRKK
jgi:hypothetical protein